MANVQIKELVTAQAVLAYVMQGLKETVVKVCITMIMNMQYHFDDYSKTLIQQQVFEDISCM